MSELEKKALSELIEGGISFRTKCCIAIRSIFDPLKMLITYMPGSIGYQIRQIYYGKTLQYLGKNAIIDVGVIIKGAENIAIGSLTWIDNNVKLESTYGSIKIGRRVHVTTGAHLIGHGGITIGDYVAIGPGSKIISGSDSSRNGKRMSGPMVPLKDRNVIARPIVIEKDAFIGANSVVLPGVVIGEGAVIGANSLVIKDVPAYAIAFGSPLRTVGKRDKVTVEDYDD